MAQIYVPDDQYQILQSLASDQHVTPEQLLAALIDQIEIARERAEYGDAFIDVLRQQANNPLKVLTYYDSTEAFLLAIREASSMSNASFSGEEAEEREWDALTRKPSAHTFHQQLIADLEDELATGTVKECESSSGGQA